VCGIAGIAGPRGDVINADSVHRMCQTIVHRGPDDEGVYVQGPIGLGMRRLSIIDLSGGRQPIHNEDQSVWVVFNGEIYNFPELRSELESRGHYFYTQSDTEVIVHLYEEMGADCVQKLRGMFAIALYDKKRESLLLARDRLGKKPLHYTVHHGRILFGSEIKAILAVSPELAEIDHDGVLQYLYFGYIADPLTAFREIHKLPPGCLLQFRDGKIDVRQYWDVPSFGTHAPATEEELLQELEKRLAEAVRIRLISDVPLGALLSGGVDSSIVVALMARASSAPVKTFSIGFRNEQFDETKYARKVADRFGTDHHELIVDPDIEQTLSFLTGMLEEPFGDSSMLPTYHVCQIARKYVTVALSGDGGDELFAGYDRYAIAMNRHETWVPQGFAELYRRHVHPALPSGTYGRNRIWNASLSTRDRYLDDVSYLPALHRERPVFSHAFLEKAAHLRNPLKPFQDYYDNAPASDVLSRLMYLDIKTYLAGDILTKVDRMSMATSLEVRVPLLDHVLVEWAATMPVEWKFRNGRRKYILKKLAERIGIPADVLHRPKQGFQLPLVDWMRHELKDNFLAILLEPRTLQRGYFKPESVRRLIKEHTTQRRNRSGILWRILILELWHRNFLEAGKFAVRPAYDAAGEVSLQPAGVAPARLSP
jgi:asparagine synthase (glutamine-hydrolysing)